MNVLSLFDGMSCLQIALRENGVNVQKYYASEIDKFAIAQTQLNFPATVQLGDITRWQEWDVDWSSVDLIGAGSPCQGFSFSGKQLAFGDPRSKLFFVFVSILEHVRSVNPSVCFLLENVNMKKEHMKVISDMVGISPVNINSNLVSAQNRNRWYWSNIRVREVGIFGYVVMDIPLPKDEGILLRDILEEEVGEKYFLSDKMVNWLQNYHDKKQSEGCGFKFEPRNTEQKGSAITARCFEMGLDDNYIVAMRGRNPDNPSDRRTGSPTEQRLEPNTTGKTNCLTSVAKDNLVMLNKRQENNLKSGEEKANTFLSTSWKGSQVNGMTLVLNENQQAKFNPNIDSEKANCLTLAMGRAGSSSEYMDAVSKVANITGRIRRLTPTECSRLQTVPDWYIWQCSDTQQYRMLGNGWTIKIISHILKFLQL